MKFCICQLDIVGEGYTAAGAVRAGDVMSSWSWTRRGGDTRQTLRGHTGHTGTSGLELLETKVIRGFAKGWLAKCLIATHIIASASQFHVY